MRIAYFFPSLISPIATPATAPRIGHAGIHHRERAAADRRHRARAVGLEDLGDDAEGVREVGEVGQHALEGALGEVAVADLAARRAAHRAHFTRGERREVVVQHERLRRLAGRVDRVEALDVVGGAERDGDERLRLAAREERGAVRARQEAGVDRDRADLVRGAAVHALLGASAPASAARCTRDRRGCP